MLVAKPINEFVILPSTEELTKATVCGNLAIVNGGLTFCQPSSRFGTEGAVVSLGLGKCCLI